MYSSIQGRVGWSTKFFFTHVQFKLCVSTLYHTSAFKGWNNRAQNLLFSLQPKNCTLYRKEGTKTIFFLLSLVQIEAHAHCIQKVQLRGEGKFSHCVYRMLKNCIKRAEFHAEMGTFRCWFRHAWCFVYLPEYRYTVTSPWFLSAWRKKDEKCLHCNSLFAAWNFTKLTWNKEELKHLNFDV
jgi:hypothetical protein